MPRSPRRVARLIAVLVLVLPAVALAGSPNINTVAGGGSTPGNAADGGPATGALLTGLTGAESSGPLSTDTSFYFAQDSVCTIRKVTTVSGADSGTLSTVAGNGNCTPASGLRSGADATTTSLNRPCCIAFAPDGTFLIGDSDNGMAQRLDVQHSTLTTVAGSTVPSGICTSAAPNAVVATSAALCKVVSVAAHPSGSVPNFLVADEAQFRSGGAHIYEVRGDGKIYDVAGGGCGGTETDVPSSICISKPRGLAYTSGGFGNTSTAFIFADAGRHVVWSIGTTDTTDATNWKAHVIAGTLGSAGNTGDGGQASSAKLNTPTDVALVGAGGTGYVIADTGNCEVRWVDAIAGTGTIRTLAGNGACGGELGDAGPATSASFSASASNPLGLATGVNGA